MNIRRFGVVHVALLAVVTAAAITAPACTSASSESDSAAAAQTERRSAALVRLGSGTWDVGPSSDLERRFPMVRAWVDASVAGAPGSTDAGADVGADASGPPPIPERRVFVEVRAAYDNGAVVRTIWPAWSKGRLAGGRERWGTDAIELFPSGGPNGSRLRGAVAFRLRMQHTESGTSDQIVVTDWERLYGSGALPPTDDDPFSSSLSSPVHRTERGADPEPHFSPYEDTALAVIREIETVIAAKQVDPTGRHTIHAAIFNVNDPRIVDAVIRAHRAGVEVRLAIDAKKLRPTATWMTGDDVLLAAGVPVLGIGYPDRGAMHLKLAVYDGKKVETGSFNWETGSSVENHENMLLLEEPALVTAYAQHFETLVGGVEKPRLVGARLEDQSSSFFGKKEKLYEIMGDLIDRANKSVHIAMFTAKADGPGGALSRLFEKVIAAKQRGLDVVFVFDAHIAEPFNFHGQESGDDQTDEWLERSGVKVIRASNDTTAFASMHHKFMVIDNAITVTGAFNWYWDAAFINDEDVVIVRDEKLAGQYTGEFADLLRRYDPGFDPRPWKQSRVEFEATYAGATAGETLLLVGEMPQAGSWNPANGIALEGSGAPTWRGAITLPAGTRLNYKLVVRQADGRLRWESGENRRAAAPSDGAPSARVSDTFRP